MRKIIIVCGLTLSTLATGAPDPANALVSDLLHQVAEADLQITLQLNKGLWRLKGTTGTMYLKVDEPGVEAVIDATVRRGQIDTGALVFRRGAASAQVHAVFRFNSGARCSMGLKQLEITTQGHVTTAPDAWLDTPNHGHNVDGCLRLIAALRLQPALEKLSAANLFASDQHPELCRGTSIPCKQVWASANFVKGVVVSARPAATAQVDTPLLRLPAGARLDLAPKSFLVLREGSAAKGLIRYDPSSAKFALELTGVRMPLLTGTLQTEYSTAKLGNGSELMCNKLQVAGDTITCNGSLTGRLDPGTRMKFASLTAQVLEIAAVDASAIHAPQVTIRSRFPEGVSIELADAVWSLQAANVHATSPTGGSLSGLARAGSPWAIALELGVWPAIGKPTARGNIPEVLLLLSASTLELAEKSQVSFVSGMGRLGGTLDTSAPAVFYGSLRAFSAELQGNSQLSLGRASLALQNGRVSTSEARLEGPLFIGPLQFESVTFGGSAVLGEELLSVDFEAGQFSGSGAFGAPPAVLSLSDMSATLRGGNAQWCVDTGNLPAALASGGSLSGTKITLSTAEASGTFEFSVRTIPMSELQVGDLMLIGASDTTFESLGDVKIEAGASCMTGQIKVSSRYEKARTIHNIPLLTAGILDAVVAPDAARIGGQRFSAMTLRGGITFVDAKTVTDNLTSVWNEGRAKTVQWLNDNRERNMLGDVDFIEDRSPKGGFAPQGNGFFLDWHYRVGNLINVPIDSPDCDLDVSTVLSLEAGVPTPLDLRLRLAPPHASVPDCDYTLIGNIAHVLFAPVTLFLLPELNAGLRKGRDLPFERPSDNLGLSDTWFAARKSAIEKVWVSGTNSIEGTVVAIDAEGGN